MKANYKTIAEYNRAQTGEEKVMCAMLKREFTTALPKATSKIWHGTPVWFLNENPVVGYHKLKDGIRVLFWSGQSLQTAGLAPEGSFKAAQVIYQSAKDIRVTVLRKWLRESKSVQWDYKNIVRHKGHLERLKIIPT